MRLPSLLPSVALIELLALAGCVSLPGQAPTTADSSTATLSHARALYYTPTDAGLEGFHCDVNFRWKEFLEKAMNQPVPDAEPRLKYLNDVHLSIDDNLHGAGELHWAAPGPPPDGTEDSVTKLRDGFQQIWSGFFQSWNGFFTGELVSPDVNSVVQSTEGGFRVTAHTGTSIAEEQYNRSLVLTTVKVSTPALESVMTPSFQPSAKGLLVSEIRSIYRQPPTAAPTEIMMRIGYGPAGSFQLPSSLAITVGPASFDFQLVNCASRTHIDSH